MKISIANLATESSYIRHARTQTLKSVRVAPHPSLTEPVPAARYLLAYDDSDVKPIGMGESAMISAVYESYDDTPYASICDLSSYCPLHQMASMRTVFVEPDHRANSSVFLALAFGSARLFRDLGARFATASTRADDLYLNRLYEKCGGERVGTFFSELATDPSSLFIFDLEKVLGNRVVQRIWRYVTFEFDAYQPTGHAA